jgi:hypothetical protein
MVVLAKTHTNARVKKLKAQADDTLAVGISHGWQHWRGPPKLSVLCPPTSALGVLSKTSALTDGDKEMAKCKYDCKRGSLERWWHYQFSFKKKSGFSFGP